ncbi:MAG: YdcF family protein [Clostridia bacterium]|nr:YdcF family protein [Clostridia bacterium]
MKLSQQNYDTLRQMPIEQITEIVYGGGSLQDDGQSGLMALLLGGNPLVMKERAQGAANLYQAGRVKYIMPTGGVKWDTEFGHISEAECMKQHLMNMGIPEEAILLENQATTTRENMIFATLQIERQLKAHGDYRVYVVTSPCHMRRSLALAKAYLPRKVLISGYPGVCPQGMPDTWHQDEFQAERVYREAELLHRFIHAGDIDDVEF